MGQHGSAAEQLKKQNSSTVFSMDPFNRMELSQVHNQVTKITLLNTTKLPSGKDLSFVFPDFRTVIRGEYEKGVLKEGRAAR